jgi:hypothetical protein
MGVDRSITRGPSQVLVLPIRDVEMGLGVTVFLGQTEINNIDLVTTLANAHEEVIRLDVTVDERLGMDVLNAGDQLVSKEKYGLQGEFAVAEVEEILQTGAKEIENHSIVVTLGSEPADKWDTDTTSKGFVNTGLIFELGMLGLDALELDGDLFTGDDIGTEIDITEGSATDLPANAVFITYAKIHSSHLDEVELWTLGIEQSDTRVVKLRLFDIIDR